MRSVRTDAMVLKQTDVFDADRLYLAVTESLGKVRVRAKGARRPSSRLAGHLLRFVPTQLELQETGDFYLVTGASSEGVSYPENQLQFLQYAELLAEVVDRLLPDKAPNKQLFTGLRFTYERLLSDPELGLALVCEWTWKALASLGYHPELHKCVVTQQPLVPQGMVWSSEAGGVISEEGLRGVAIRSMPVRKETVVLLRLWLDPRFVTGAVQVAPEVVHEAAVVVMDYLQTQIGKPLKSWRSNQ